MQVWPTRAVANNQAYIRPALTRLSACRHAAAVLGRHRLDAAVELGSGEGVEEGVDGRVDGQNEHRYPGVQRRWRKQTSCEEKDGYVMANPEARLSGLGCTAGESVSSSRIDYNQIWIQTFNIGNNRRYSHGNVLVRKGKVTY